MKYLFQFIAKIMIYIITLLLLITAFLLDVIINLVYIAWNFKVQSKEYRFIFTELATRL